MSQSPSKERPYSGPTLIILRNAHPERKSAISHKKFFCNGCGKTYKTKKILKHHISKFHPSELHLRNFNPSELSAISHKKFVCNGCGKTYTTRKILRYHIKKSHPSELFKLAPPVQSLKSYKYQCDCCEKRFNQFRNYNYHKRKVHNDGGSSIPIKTRKCPICDNHFERKYFSDHLQEVHEISMETEKIEFATLEDFNVWKEDMEKQTKYKYVKNSGTKMNGKSNKCHYFTCHRSGNFVSGSKGVRKVKSKGSNKIGGFCPASMTVLEDENGKCSVVFTKTHIGHENDLDHLVLTKSERQTLAKKIASKLPFDIILDDVRNSVSESESERLHLLTRQDLYNVTNSFNLSSTAVLHKEDSDNEADNLMMQESSESATSSSMSLNEKRENVIKTCIEFINSLSTDVELDAFEEHVIAAKPIISALHSDIEKSSMLPTTWDNVPANKFIKPKQSFSVNKE